MNTSYRSIFSHTLGTWVAVSELTAGRGKRAGSAVALVAALTLLAASPAGAQSALYWDLNGATPGAGGAAPSGSWNTSTPNWSTAAAGDVATGLWSDGSLAVFAAGTDATGSYGVTLNNDVSAAGLSYRGGAPGSQLTLNGGNTLTLAGASMPQVDVDAGTTLRITAGVAGASGLGKTGAGTLALTAPNTYSGGTVVSGGTLAISSDANLGDASGNLTLANGSTLRLDADNVNSSRALTLQGAGGRIDVNATQGGMFTGNITGAGALTVVNTGAYVNNEDIRLTLRGNNDYTGGTILGIPGVDGGRVNALVLGSASGVGTGPVDIYMNSELKFSGAVSTAGNLNITSHESTDVLGTNSGVYFIDGATAGNSHISIHGLGSYVLFDGAGTTAGNSLIDVDSGRVQFFGASQGGSATINNTNGGMIDVRGTADLSGATVHNTNGQLFVSNLTASGVAIGSLDGAGAVVLGGKQLTVGGLGQSGAIGGVISDTGTGYQDSKGQDYVSPAVLTGGSLVKEGAGTLVLAGNNTYSGSTTVNGGTLRIDGDESGAPGAYTVNAGGTLSTGAGGLIASQVDVLSGGTLAGSGTMSKQVTVQNGAHLAPGNGGVGTLTVGTLVLQPGAQMDFELGQAGTAGGPLNDLVHVTGNLTLGGTLNVAASSGGSFGPGLYRLFDYDGTLTNTGVGFGSVPGSASDLYLQTSVLQQVNLVNSAGVQVTFWDGNNTANINNSKVDGGAGTWQLGAGLDRWTTASGAMNAPWTNDSFAIFQGAPGTVTVSNAGGNVSFSGAQFAVDGYRIDGAPLTTNTANTVIRVGDGTSAGAAYTATIDAQITGAGGLSKQDLGTLALSGANTYAGGTQLVQGTLLANNSQALGSGTLTIQGGTLGSQTNAVLANNVVVAGDFGIANSGSPTPSLTLAGDVSLASTAKVTQASAGTVNLTGAISGAQGLTLDATASGARYVYSGTASNTYSGTTTVQGNALLELQRSGGATAVAGDLAVAGQGAVVLGASEQIANTAAVTLNGAGQGGSDALQFAAAGLTETVASLAGSGKVGLNGSTLAVGSGNFSGEIRDNGAAGGGLQKVGSGVLNLSGANSYSGATTVSGGTLQAGAVQAFSANSAHTVASGAVLDTAGFNQTVASLANSGTVSLLGSTPGSSLAVNGAYVGNNGTLRLGAALNATGPSDQLVLNGAGASASGHTNVQVVNLGGLGALTSGAGIEVIAARNGATTTAQTTRDAFSLAGGHVDAGAYEYRLYAADQNGAGESWYLRSTTTAPLDPSKPAGPQEAPRYRAEVPMFAALPAQLRQSDLTMLGNLHRRVGDEDARAPGSDAGERRAWARLIGADLDIRQQGTVSPASSGHLQGVQAGTDLFAVPASNWRAGIYVGQMDGDADVSGLARDGWGAVGSTELRSRYFGAYATYSAPTGFYADAVLQYGKHDYTFNPTGNAQVNGKGDGVQASIEVGQSIGMGGGWFIEPQAQLVHEQINLDAVNLGGTMVDNNADNGWLARLGVRVRGQMSTGIGSLQPYARVNLYRASNGQDMLRFTTPAASTTIASPSDYTSLEVAGGFTLAVSPSVSFYSEVGHLVDVGGGDARVKSAIEGSAGMRVRW